MAEDKKSQKKILRNEHKHLIHHNIPSLKHTHFIQSWPKKFPAYKKIIANFFYLLHGVIVHEKKSLLTKEDMFKANLKLKKGDFILTGNLHEMTSILIGGAVTHAALYIGKRTFIQATGVGVHYTTLHQLFSNHDTFAILRLPQKVKSRNKIIKKAISFGHEQIGKKYDYFFQQSESKFFCSELVNACFHHAGYKTGLRSVKPAHNWEEKLIKKATGALKALHPEHMINGNFEIIFLSHNLKLHVHPKTKKHMLVLHEDTHQETLTHLKKHHKAKHKEFVTEINQSKRENYQKKKK